MDTSYLSAAHAGHHKQRLQCCSATYIRLPGPAAVSDLSCTCTQPLAASMASKAAAAAAKAIYAEPAFIPKGPINSGRFNLIREIVIGTTLGIAGGLVWKTWHWSEKRRIASFYTELAKKELEDENAYRASVADKLRDLEDALLG